MMGQELNIFPSKPFMAVKKTSLILTGSVTVSSLSCIDKTRFLLILDVATAWKYLVFRSPWESQVHLALCFHLASMLEANWNALSLSPWRLVNSSMVSCLVSCTLSNSSIVLLQFSSCFSKTPNSASCQIFKALCKSLVLKWKEWIGSTSSPGACYHRFCTINLGVRYLNQ